MNINLKNGLIAGILLVIIIGGLTLISSFTHEQKSSSTKALILTTFAPLYGATASIAGEKWEVQNIVPAGVGPHTFSPTPQTINDISKASIIVINGLGIDSFVDKLITSTNKQDLTVVDTSKEIQPLGELSDALDPNSVEEKTAINSESSGEGDPHIWLSIENHKKQAATILKALTDKDPQEASYYTENYNIYIGKLTELQSKIKQKIDQSNLKGKQFVAFHSAFQYYAQEFGLIQKAAIEEFPGKEPSAQYIANLMTLIRDNNITIVFTEPQFSPKIVTTLTQDLKIKQAELDPLESSANLNPNIYLDVMKKNTDTIIANLKD